MGRDPARSKNQNQQIRNRVVRSNPPFKKINLAGVISKSSFWQEQQVQIFLAGTPEFFSSPKSHFFATFILADARDFKNQKPETF